MFASTDLKTVLLIFWMDIHGAALYLASSVHNDDNILEVFMPEVTKKL